jgi:hypothetical protein
MKTKKTMITTTEVYTNTEDSNLSSLEKKLVLHFNCLEEACIIAP